MQDPTRSQSLLYKASFHTPVEAAPPASLRGLAASAAFGVMGLRGERVQAPLSLQVPPLRQHGPEAKAQAGQP